MTGIDIQLEDAYVLDRREANAVLRDLREKVKTLEHLIAELGQFERVVLPHRQDGKPFTRLDSRLICLDIAKALSVVCPDKALFVRWTEWKIRRAEYIRKLRNRGGVTETGPRQSEVEKAHESDA